MGVDKRIGEPLADKSAVGSDKSAPTLGLEYFVNIHYYLSFFFHFLTNETPIAASRKNSAAVPKTS
jgi:hypothetical protein